MDFVVDDGQNDGVVGFGLILSDTYPTELKFMQNKARAKSKESAD
jgi:hypothetical protein